MDVYRNSEKGKGLSDTKDMASGEICLDGSTAERIFKLCPAAAPTPLVGLPAIADRCAVRSVYAKDERNRIGLGSFKALGAAYAIAKQADDRVEKGLADSHENALRNVTFVCASAGNHGLSMAAGARLFGAAAVVFIAETVPEAFAMRLRDKGAEVIRAGDTYEASMAAAMDAASANGWQLLPDSSWVGCTAPARDVMEGYLLMGAEIDTQIDTEPTHVFLQAGVGGLAAAAAASARQSWGAAPKILVVEPDRAPALCESVKAGRPVTADGPVSNMGRLDCKEPSHLALKYLAREANVFLTISDDEAIAAVDALREHGIDTTPSGAAGLAALLVSAPYRDALALTPESRVLIYLSEGPEDG